MKKIYYFLMAIKSALSYWSIKTVWKKYKTEEEWLKNGEPLDWHTSWEVAKAIWLS